MEVPLWSVILVAISPIPGLLAAIPMSILARNDPGWVWLIAGPLLAYVQVLVVDFGWSLLLKWKAWGRLLDRMRSPRVEKLMASKGGFWTVFFGTPTIGPWVIMAFMRYAQVPQRKVAAPMLLALFLVSCLAVGACTWFPELV